MARACEVRQTLIQLEIMMVADTTPPGPLREMNRATAPLTRKLVRLRHRPGAVHRRRGGDERDS